MRVIIAGSRTITNLALVRVAMTQSGLTPTRVVSGTARGADMLGEMWANENGVPVVRYPADWDGLGKRAGYVRNRLMADNADALVALWDGCSKGTKDMIETARLKGLEVYVAMLPPDPPR